MHLNLKDNDILIIKAEQDCKSNSKVCSNPYHSSTSISVPFSNIIPLQSVRFKTYNSPMISNKHKLNIVKKMFFYFLVAINLQVSSILKITSQIGQSLNGLLEKDFILYLNLKDLQGNKCKFQLSNIVKQKCLSMTLNLLILSIINTNQSTKKVSS